VIRDDARVSALADAVRAELAARADPERAPGMQRYMKSALPCHGVRRAGQAQVARAVFPAHPLAGFDAWRDAVLELWREAAYREERYAALDLLADRRYREHRTPRALPVYEELIVTGAWWDLVDPVATRRLEELFPAVEPVLRQWSIDADLWKRRSAIIAQVHRNDQTDFALLADVIEPNRGDRDFFIRKAIGWALRAYAWTDPDAVVAYCEAHELSGLSRREALKHTAAAPAPRGARASASGRTPAPGA
jgi:3-methyladenine DNA glycosylase AlkD